MNAFLSVRPRGTTAPAKLPVQRKPSAPITIKGTTRVMSAAGRFQATLEPDYTRTIATEGSRGKLKISFAGTRRVLNVNGKLQAPLNPDASRSIVIEGAEQGRASSDKRRRISPSGTK